MNYEADPALRVGSDPRVLIGGSPRRVFVVSDRAASLIDRLPAGVDAEGLTAPERALLGRLVDAGAAHPRPTDIDLDSASPHDVGVVVPVRDRPGALRRCLGALVRSGLTRIVVVDDGSRDGPLHAAVAAEFGAAVVRRDTSGGPAAARMAGVEDLDSPLIAFVDSDVEVSEGWWRPLVSLMADVDPLGGRIGLVAPRQRVARGRASGESVLVRYEASSSPLDLGARRSPVRRDAVVPYVPAAALLVRRDALGDVGGFDVALGVGEDVDLVWRLNDAGWSVRYEPDATAYHEVRPSWRTTLARRADYGRSAAMLDARHRGAVPALRVTPWSLAVAGMALAGHPVAASATALWSAIRLSRRLGSVPEPTRTALRLVAEGHAHAVRSTGRALVRPWWPVTLPLALGSQRVRRAVLAGTAASAAWEWWHRRPELDPIRFTVASVADDVAYSVGVWSGSLRAGHYGALMIRFHDRTARRP